MTLQFKIQLNGFINPVVWRQIEVPADYTFFQFYKVITICFGKKIKKNFIYTFSPAGKDSTPQISSVAPIYNDSPFANNTFLHSLFLLQGQSFTYVPDFDELFLHHIKLQKIDRKVIPYPVCLAGGGAYPPVMCSNVDDYEAMKQALADKNNPQHESVRKWLDLEENETWEEKYKFDRSKVNEQLKQINAEMNAFRQYTRVRFDTFDSQFGLTLSHWKEIDNIKIEMQDKKNWNQLASKLKKLTTNYPAIPQYKNSVASLYLLTGKKKLFLESAKEIMQQFPNYIMTRCSLINFYIREYDLEQALELLGKNLDLNEVYPLRSGKFTEVEVFTYHSAAFRYLIAIRDPETAQKHYDYLEYIYPNAPDLENFRLDLNFKNMEKSLREKKNQREVKVIPEKIFVPKSKPTFDNPDILLIYQHDYNINIDILTQIINLPRESVIKDLEKALIDSFVRLEYFKKSRESQFMPMHALTILSVMQAEEALETLFKILRQGQSYFDHWFGLFYSVEVWRFVYSIGQNYPDRLKAFVVEPNHYKYAPIAVCKALKYRAIYNQESMAEVIQWQQSVLQYLLAHQDDTDVFDSFLYLTLLHDFLDFAGKEHLPIFLTLYEAHLLDEKERLSLKEIKKRLARPYKVGKADKILTTIDQFYDCWKKWYRKDNPFVHEEAEQPSVPKNNKPVAEPPAVKAGRNDPCPCGSGKKYKKCCG